MALACLGLLKYLLIGVSIFVVWVNCTENSNQEQNVRVKREDSIESDLEVIKIQNRELLGHLAGIKNELINITKITTRLQNQVELLNTELRQVKGKIAGLVAADIERNSQINASILDITHMKDSIQELEFFNHQLLYHDPGLPFQICSKMVEAGDHEHALKFVQRTKAQIEKNFGSGSDVVVRLSLCEARVEMANNSISGIQNLRAIYEAAKSKHGSDHPLVKEIFHKVPRNCCSIQKAGYKSSGAFTIPDWQKNWKEIHCDLETSGGGWTSIMRSEAKPLGTDQRLRLYGGTLAGDIDINWTTLTNDYLKQRQLLRVELIDERDVSTHSVNEIHVNNIHVNRPFALRIFNNSETTGGNLSVAESLVCSRYGQMPSCGPCVFSSSDGWWERKCDPFRFRRHYASPLPNFGVWQFWRLEMKIRPHGFPKGCLTS